MTLTISPGRVGDVLNIRIVLLLFAHIGGQYSAHILGHGSLKGSVPRFNMNGEGSVPTWYAVILLVMCAALLAVCAIRAYRAAAPDFRGWTGLALIFAYISLGEAIAIHEFFIDPLRDLFGITRGWLYFAWVIPAAVAVLMMALAYRPFVGRLPAATRFGFLAAGACYVTGALGIEAFSGWYLSTRGDDLTYEMIGAGEELLELEGTVVFLATLIAYLGGTISSLELRFLGE